jgi:hypothetical protein
MPRYNEQLSHSAARASPPRHCPGRLEFRVPVGARRSSRSRGQCQYQCPPSAPGRWPRRRCTECRRRRGPWPQYCRSEVWYLVSGVVFKSKINASTKHSAPALALALSACSHQQETTQHAAAKAHAQTEKAPTAPPSRSSSFSQTPPSTLPARPAAPASRSNCNCNYNQAQHWQPRALVRRWAVQECRSAGRSAGPAGVASTARSPLALTIGAHHWRSPLALTIGSHHWLTPLALTIGSHHWLSPLALTIGAHHWRSPLALTIGSHSHSYSLSYSLSRRIALALAWCYRRR